MAYMAMVHSSNLEYCATVWNPYKKKHVRFVTNRFHNTSLVTDMLAQAALLEARRCKLQQTMFYKIVNNMVDTLLFPPLFIPPPLLIPPPPSSSLLFPSHPLSCVLLLNGGMNEEKRRCSRM